MAKRTVSDVGRRRTMKHLGPLPSVKSWQAAESNWSGVLSSIAKDIHGRSYPTLR